MDKVLRGGGRGEIRIVFKAKLPVLQCLKKDAPMFVNGPTFLKMSLQLIQYSLVTRAADSYYFDPDPTFHFDMDPDLTISYRSRSSLFHSGNVLKMILFLHLNLIFLVGRSARTQPAGICCQIFTFSQFCCVHLE